MKCWKCGAELQDGGQFCGSCGARQAQQAGDPFAGPTPSAPPLPRVDLGKPGSQSGGPTPGGGFSGPSGGPASGGGGYSGPSGGPASGGGGYNGPSGGSGPSFGGGQNQKIVLTVFSAVCGAVYGVQAIRGVLWVLRFLFGVLLPDWRYFGILGTLPHLVFDLFFAVTSLWMCVILLMLAFRRTRQNSDGLILCLGSGAAAIVILRVLYMLVCLIIPGMGLNFSVYLSTLLRSIAGAAIALGGVYCILRFLMGEMPLAGKTTADFQNDVREAFQSSARAAGEAGAQAARAAQNARNDWNARQTPPPPGGGVMRLKADRSLLLYILLNFITCGIYGLYFIYALARDVNVACAGDGQNTAGLLKLLLFSFLTCGLYSIFWYYSLGNRLAYNAPRYGLSLQENGTTILLWYLVGLLLCGLGPLVAMYIIIKNTNALCGAYNYRHGM